MIVKRLKEIQEKCPLFLLKGNFVQLWGVPHGGYALIGGSDPTQAGCRSCVEPLSKNDLMFGLTFADRRNDIGFARVRIIDPVGSGRDV